jgi:DNA-directed RNA polymerase alpha subunit
MSYILNKKDNNNTLTFNLDNSSKNIKISLANAIRRTIISDIYTYAIDDKTIIFHENNSVLNNEFLKHRLTLIPIKSDLDIDYENLVITCKKNNDNELTENIYVSDFECKDINKNTIIDNILIFPYPKILFAKIKNGQYISFECKLTRNNSEHGGSIFCPVSTCIYTFKIDEKKSNEILENLEEDKKKIFLTQEIQRVYEKNEIGDPNSYEFVIESIGFYECDKIIDMGINSLIDKLNIIKNEIKNNNSKKINLIQKNNEFYSFLIDHENETIGNLLSTYLSYDKEVFYCGYIIEHPLKNNIILKIKLNNDNNLENIIFIIEKNIDIILDLLEKVKLELRKNS